MAGLPSPWVLPADAFEDGLSTPLPSAWCAPTVAFTRRVSSVEREVFLRARTCCDQLAGFLACSHCAQPFLVRVVEEADPTCEDAVVRWLALPAVKAEVSALGAEEFGPRLHAVESRSLVGHAVYAGSAKVAFALLWQLRHVVDAEGLWKVHDRAVAWDKLASFREEDLCGYGSDDESLRRADAICVVEQGLGQLGEW
ncbi:MAG: hypothetical protein JKY65_09275 [Planctomycetes bacterium]|nr:hypothetical protein [Planctomycetota bacterium]